MISEVLNVVQAVPVPRVTQQQSEQKRAAAEAPVDVIAAGRLQLDRTWYLPLDSVCVTIHPPGRLEAADWLLTAEDAEGNCYFKQKLLPSRTPRTISFAAAGRSGAHTVRLGDVDQKLHRMLAHFELRVKTCVQTPDARLNNLIPLTRDRLRLNRRRLLIAGKETAAYVGADSWNYQSVWLRDMAYQLRAVRYWEPELRSCLEPFFFSQQPNGKLYDNYNPSGALHRMASESDLEYILVLAAHWIWQATGDAEWLRARWPQLERALAYPRKSGERWSDAHQLVARGHTCDTWDFNHHAEDELFPRVVATCDVSGFFLAHQFMVSMAEALGLDAEAHRKEAQHIREASRRYLWDGSKFRHHVHVDPVDHGVFDESEQLAMGNTWAITRGLADREQARAIVATYFQRAKQTGQRPWWSLQPGYPNHLGYFGGSGVLRQGGYANGGLMPWVGGELCHGCFLAGETARGWALLADYLNFLQVNGGEVYTWYWPDMRPAYRNPNATSHCGWGMAEWVCALIEGLAGVRDQSSLLQTVEIQPRWGDLGFNDVKVVVRYGPSEHYVAYRIRRVDSSTQEIELAFTGAHVRWVDEAGTKTKTSFSGNYACWQRQGSSTKKEQKQ